MRRLQLVLLLACCAGVWLPGAARASEPASAAAARTGKAAAAKPEAAKAGGAASDEPGDSLDELRRKLAERLSSKAGGGAGPVQLTNKSAADAAASSAGVKSSRSAAGRKAAATHAGKEIHWSYEGEGGPEHWGELNPEFSKCASGTRQSPIDIRDGIAVDLQPIGFDYKVSSFAVIDNGHTVQVNVGAGNSIQVMGRRYELLQFHFHRPSEERINGRQFDMVIHLVHKDSDGRLAVVAVLLDRGSVNPVMQTVWANLPLEKSELVPAQLHLDLNQLLPESRLYYTYMGSLTTPPCSEGVLWMVLKSPLQVSTQQINIFSRLYPMNARPVQPSHGRLIKESN
jgi:carbonic anhydrase